MCKWIETPVSEVLMTEWIWVTVSNEHFDFVGEKKCLHVHTSNKDVHEHAIQRKAKTDPTI